MAAPHARFGREVPETVLRASERRGSALRDPDGLRHGRGGREFVEASKSRQWWAR